MGVMVLFLCLVALFMSSMPEANTRSVATPITTHHHTSSFNRTSFPSGFLFGTASSAYQYEGAAYEGGKGPSVWDTYTRTHPERIKGGGNGNVAVDSYHRYKEDVGIMKEMGLDAYRFSISWARVLPHGKLSKGVNKEGIQYYNNLINELLSNGLKPFITLFHWDLPQALEAEYGGFLSPRIVNDYKDYTELCYKEFGDRVKNWITFNEPWSYTLAGYVIGMFPPLRCSVSDNLNCTRGDSGREPYIVAHHLLLAHAASYNLYKHKYKASQKGEIGITLVSLWAVPLSNDRHDLEAAYRALDFIFGWFMDPLTHGTYPKTMISNVGKRLPKFTKEQSVMVKGSFDFVGINYYSAIYIANLPFAFNINPSYLTDARVIITTTRNGVAIGPPEAGSDLLAIYPRGFQDLLIYTKRKYNNPIIYITENGISEINNSSFSLKEALEDHARVDFYIHHLLYLQRAIKITRITFN